MFLNAIYNYNKWQTIELDKETIINHIIAPLHSAITFIIEQDKFDNPIQYNVGITNIKFIKITTHKFPKNYLSKRSEILNKLHSVPLVPYTKIPLIIDQNKRHKLFHSLCNYGMYKEASKILTDDTFHDPICKCLFALGQYDELYRSESFSRYLFAYLFPINMDSTEHQQFIFSAFCSLRCYIYSQVHEPAYQSVLGHIMLFYSDVILKYINKMTAEELYNYTHSAFLNAQHFAEINKDMPTKISEQCSQEIKTESFIEESNNFCKSQMEIIRKYATNNSMKTEGRYYLLRGCKSEKDLQVHSAYCRAEYEAKISKNTDLAEIYYVIAITKDNGGYLTLICRMLALIGLSNICCQSDEYIISKKALRIAYKICHGSFLNCFDKHDYRKYQKTLLKKLKKAKCENCKSAYKNKRLKACTNCMKTFYCNRNCQKMHWYIYLTIRGWSRFQCALISCSVKT
eukprot:408126_1